MQNLTYKSTLKALKRPQKALKPDLLSSASWAKLLFCFCFSVYSFESHPQCGHLLALIKNSMKCLVIKMAILGMTLKTTKTISSTQFGQSFYEVTF